MHQVSHAEASMTLNVKVMMQEAVQTAGLSDYGDLEFVAALKKMVECYAADGGFHAEGLVDFRRNIIRDLVNRLRFQHDLKKHPEILDEDVSDPIVIMGLPRSGTTKLHRMIGSDPGLLSTYMWQMLNPAPFPDAVPGQRDPRIAAANSQDAALLADVPELSAGHYYSANALDDSNYLFSGTFNHGWSIAGGTRSLSFDEWARSRNYPSDLYNFSYVRSLLQYLQWQQGGRQGRRWLLKNTSYAGYMDELLKVHPNSALIHIHRHPRSSLASGAKLVSALWARRAVGVSPQFTGGYWLNRHKIMMEKYLRDRDRLDLDGRILDVNYEKIRSDPMPSIRGIYRRADRALTAEAEQKMLQWEKDNEQGKHGSHIYTLEEFGLSDAIIDEAFAPYIERFVEV